MTIWAAAGLPVTQSNAVRSKDPCIRSACARASSCLPTSYGTKIQNKLWIVSIKSLKSGCRHLRVPQGGLLAEAPSRLHCCCMPWLAPACCYGCLTHFLHYSILNSLLPYAWVQLVGPGAEPCIEACNSFMSNATKACPGAPLCFTTSAAAASGGAFGISSSSAMRC